jgi:GNAT superfamily N-acetyltransferase
MTLSFRKATRNDLPTILSMLANDPLGKLRERLQEPLPLSYYDAFEKINIDKNQELMVAEDEQAMIVATFQISFLQYLTYQGGLRAQIEAVRVREDQRGQGLGEKIITWAMQRAKEKGAHLVQLTTDKKRHDAIRFYEKLGFVASHEGMKLHL